MWTEAEAAHLNRICRYLARDDFGHRGLHASDVQALLGRPQFDAVAVFGNQVLATVERACTLFRQGLATRLLFSGGIGHSTALLYANLRTSRTFGALAGSGAMTPDMAEAEMLAVIAASGFDIPESAILVESRSTNTGENARFSLELLQSRMPGVRSLLVLQDPVMQRRTMLTLEHSLHGVREAPALLSHSVFVPEVSAHGFVTPVGSTEPPPWTAERFVSLVLGEVERLRNDARGYGPNGRGFIPAEDVPAEVLASYAAMQSVGRITAQ